MTRPTADIVADLRTHAHVWRVGGDLHQLQVDAADRLAELDLLVRDLASDDECYFDHHGYCQAHIWFDTDRQCPHARAKALP